MADLVWSESSSLPGLRGILVSNVVSYLQLESVDTAKMCKFSEKIPKLLPATVEWKERSLNRLPNLNTFETLHLHFESP